ncbi:MAG TPA: hypothetical protein GX731_04065 [Clostridiales bacterium]|nr:hypothetical protein [Clostridiales bacterium]
MNVLFKYIFEDFFGNITLVNDALTNIIILSITGTIAFISAYRFVGDLYRLGFISGKTTGSAIHWLVRAIILVAELLIVRVMISLVIWVGRFIG